jgi:hypothetical protein
MALMRLLLSAASVLLAADAARLDSWDQTDLDLPPGARKILASPDSMICGGSAIAQLLSAPTSVDQVRNINWAQVSAIVDEYLRTQGTEVARLQAEVDRLKLEIPRMEQMEKPQKITQQQIRDAVTAAVSDAKSYKSLDAAKASKCGAVMTSPRSPRSSVAFPAALAAFGTNIQSLLSGNIYVEGQTFRDECAAWLGSDGPSNNCVELCQQLADAAQAASDRTAGAKALNGRSSDQLRRQLDDTTALLKTALAGVEGCKQTKADLDVFKAQLQGLQVGVKDTHEKLMGARDAWMDAQDELEGAEAAVKAQ